MEVSFNGKTYPMVLTMGAILEFKRLTGKDVSSLEGDDLEGLLAICYCCLASACRAKEMEFPYTLQAFADNCTIEDINTMSAQIAAQQAEEAKKKEAGKPQAKRTRSKA